MRWTPLLGLICLGAAWLLSQAATPPPPAAARIALGWRLLADRRLSLSSNLACLDCHMPARGYSDGRAVATADGLNTPPLWGLAARTTFGWFTPEVRSLEGFILRPLSNPREMGPLAGATIERLRADPALRAGYAAAFPNARVLVTWEQTGQALAAAIRAIPLPDSDYRRGALGPAATRGQALFVELGCERCHRPPSMSSAAYINIGVSDDTRRNNGMARVPALIGLAQTAPYFHDGSAATLTDVVRAYGRGGQVPGPAVNPAIRPFVITDDELRDLVAFLASL
jgi:cytochrome c peroxidase